MVGKELKRKLSLESLSILKTNQDYKYLQRKKTLWKEKSL